MGRAGGEQQRVGVALRGGIRVRRALRRPRASAGGGRCARAPGRGRAPRLRPAAAAALASPVRCGHFCTSVAAKVGCSPLYNKAWRFSFTDEWETETVVTGAGDGEGARLEEHVAAKCSWWRAVSGACAKHLLQRRDEHFTRLHAIFSLAASGASH